MPLQEWPLCTAEVFGDNTSIIRAPLRLPRRDSERSRPKTRPEFNGSLALMAGSRLASQLPRYSPLLLGAHVHTLCLEDGRKGLKLPESLSRLYRRTFPQSSRKLKHFLEALVRKLSSERIEVSDHLM